MPPAGACAKPTVGVGGAVPAHGEGWLKQVCSSNVRMQRAAISRIHLTLLCVPCRSESELAAVRKQIQLLQSSIQPSLPD